MCPTADKGQILCKKTNDVSYSKQSHVWISSFPGLWYLSVPCSSLNITVRWDVHQPITQHTNAYTSGCSSLPLSVSPIVCLALCVSVSPIVCLALCLSVCPSVLQPFNTTAAHQPIVPVACWLQVLAHWCRPKDGQHLCLTEQQIQRGKGAIHHHSTLPTTHEYNTAQ